MHPAAPAARETPYLADALPRRALALVCVLVLHLGLLCALGRGLCLPERTPERMPESEMVLSILTAPAPPPEPAPRLVPQRVEHSARPAPVPAARRPPAPPHHPRRADALQHSTPATPPPAPRARPRALPVAASAAAVSAPLPRADRASAPGPARAPAPAPAPTTPTPPSMARGAEMPASAPPSVGLLCPQQRRPRIPDLAIEQGIGGTVLARAVVQHGRVRSVTIVSGPSVFRAAVRRAMLDYRCSDQGTRAVTVTQEFRFDIQ